MSSLRIVALASVLLHVAFALTPPLCSDLRENFAKDLAVARESEAPFDERHLFDGPPRGESRAICKESCKEEDDR